MMTTRASTRKADADGRIVLFPDFANTSVVVERVNDDEIRIRKLRTVRRFSLVELLDGITADNLHGEVDVGPAVGNEML